MVVRMSPYTRRQPVDDKYPHPPPLRRNGSDTSSLGQTRLHPDCVGVYGVALMSISSSCRLFRLHPRFAAGEADLARPANFAARSLWLFVAVELRQKSLGRLNFAPVERYLVAWHVAPYAMRQFLQFRVVCCQFLASHRFNLSITRINAPGDSNAQACSRG